MQDNAIVITGTGAAVSIGATIEELMDSIRKKRSSYTGHRQIEDRDNLRHLAAYTDDGKLLEGISPRKSRKLDRFSLLALQAFRQAYESSGMNEEISHDFGIFFGNSTGGWSYVEPQLDEIYSGNYEELSPYVATAWFPTAPQGEISIEYKISGYSKTFSADSLSAGYAIDHAIYLMNNNYLPGAFVGAGEAPLTPLVYNACIRANEVSFSGSYAPYSENASGCLLGEGAGILTLEKYQDAKNRGKEPLAVIRGLGIDSSLSGSIKKCLEEAGRKTEDIDCVFLDAKASVPCDRRELAELASLFSGRGDPFLTTCKPLYGHLLGADFAVELTIAVQALQENIVPCGLFKENSPAGPGFGHLVVDGPMEAELNSILIYSCHSNGASICILIEKGK